MTGSGRGVVALSDDQFPAAQCLKGNLDSALREAGRIGKCSYTRDDRLPSFARSLTVKIEINQISGRLLIMSDQITHQHVENVIVNWNGFAKSRHGGYSIGYTDKQTGTPTRARARKPLQITPKRL